MTEPSGPSAGLGASASLSNRGAKLAGQLAADDAARGNRGSSLRTLWAVSDLHISTQSNRELVDSLVVPRDPGDWLIVAGDIAEDLDEVSRTLDTLRQRFDQVIFSPGNHELYSQKTAQFNGKAKYYELIRRCQELGVATPEDPYLVFAGHTIVPMFTLYDHSWRTPGTTTEQALVAAKQRGVVLTDEFAIAPFVDVPAWCKERLSYTVQRLGQVSGPTVLVNHWPLSQAPLTNVRFPDIGLWSGTKHTEQWAQRYDASAVIYGHLHVPLELEVARRCHAEVSLGYPRENRKTLPPRRQRGIWPYPVLIDPKPEGCSSEEF